MAICCSSYGRSVLLCSVCPRWISKLSLTDGCYKSAAVNHHARVLVDVLFMLSMLMVKWLDHLVPVWFEGLSDPFPHWQDHFHVSCRLRRVLTSPHPTAFALRPGKYSMVGWSGFSKDSDIYDFGYLLICLLAISFYDVFGKMSVQIFSPFCSLGCSLSFIVA